MARLDTSGRGGGASALVETWFTRHGSADLWAGRWLFVMWMVGDWEGNGEGKRKERSQPRFAAGFVPLWVSSVPDWSGTDGTRGTALGQALVSLPGRWLAKARRNKPTNNVFSRAVAADSERPGRLKYRADSAVPTGYGSSYGNRGRMGTRNGCRSRKSRRGCRRLEPARRPGDYRRREPGLLLLRLLPSLRSCDPPASSSFGGRRTILHTPSPSGIGSACRMMLKPPPP